MPRDKAEEASKGVAVQKGPSQPCTIDPIAKSNTRAAWAMVGATVATCVVLILQWRTLQETNRLAAIAQRPYVASTDVSFSQRELPGYWIFDVLVQNSGGTPTRDMVR